MLIRYILLSVVLLLSACQLIKVEQAAFTPSVPLKYDNNAELLFNPQGKEAFVLKSKPSHLQKQGYARFCRNSVVSQCKNKLPYLRFNAMKGYFDQNIAVATDDETYEFYPVVLENGDKYFFLSFKDEGGRYGKTSPIKSLYLADNYEKKPVFDNSPIQIVGEYRSFKTTFFLLSTGDTVAKEHLDNIRKISAKYKLHSRVSSLLLDTDIEYNAIYNSYLISPKALTSKSDFKLIIGLNDESKWLRFKISNETTSLSNFNSYSIVADKLQWRSPIVKFEVEEKENSLSEFFEISANSQEIAHASAMAKASRSLFRFHGGNKVVYQLLKSAQKKRLANIISLYQSLNTPQT